MTTRDIVVVQEDDWGPLNILAVDTVNGQVDWLRKSSFSKAFYDDADGVLVGQSTILVNDADGTLAFYDLDGVEIFSTSRGGDDYNGDSTDGIAKISGDIYGIMCRDRDYNHVYLEIDPINKTINETIVIANGEFPDFENADGFYSAKKFAWIHNGEHFCCFNAGQFTYKKVNGVWEAISSNSRPGSGMPVVSQNSLAWVYTTGSDYRKYTLDLTTGVVTDSLVKANAYLDQAPAFPRETQLYMRSSASDQPNRALYYTGEDNLLQPVAVLDVENSGPNGQGRALLFYQEGQGNLYYDYHEHILNRQARGVIGLELFFNSVTGPMPILTDSNGAGLYMKDGKFTLLSQDLVTVYGVFDIPVTPGNWVQMWIGHKYSPNDMADGTIWRIAVNGVTAEIDANNWGLQYEQLGVRYIGRSPYGPDLLLDAKLGGFEFCWDYYGNFSMFTKSNLVTDPAIPSSVTVEPITFYNSVTRGSAYLRGDRISDDSSDVHPKYFLDGTEIQLATDQYQVTKEVTASPRPWENSYNTTHFKIGNYYLELAPYALRLRTPEGVTNFEYIAPNDEDRELSYSGFSRILRNMPLYKVEGTVKTAGNAAMPGVKISLLDETGTQLLAETETDANGVYRFYCLTQNKKTVLARTSNNAQNFKTSAHITPIPA